MNSFLPLLLLIASGPLLIQDIPDIEGYIGRIRSGGVGEVKEEIPRLLDRYPNDPGVLYLEGLVTEDGADAVRIFQGIVDNHPESEWADDALYRVYQFYFAIGLYRTAELKWDQLKERYPSSGYLSSDRIAPDSSADGAPVVGGSNRSEDRERSAETAHDMPAGQFALQVGAYSSRENAEKQKLFFEDLGYPVEVINRVREARSLFLVLVGNYLTYEEAKVKGATIRRSYNIESFVVSR